MVPTGIPTYLTPWPPVGIPSEATKSTTQFKRIVTHNFSDGVRPVSKWSKILMGACDVLFLHMKPHLVTNLKLVRSSMMVMPFLILGIGLLQDIMNLFLEVMDLFIEFGWYVCLGLSVGRLYRGSWNGKSYINGGQWLEP
jgi:hypothetical protein